MHITSNIPSLACGRGDIVLRNFPHLQSYPDIFQQMQTYTKTRDASTPDALWFLEHFPVFTQGQAGKKEHILNPGDTPIVQSDRGGQVTYHGPGQLIVYTLIDLKRLGYNVKRLVQTLENCIILLLKEYEIPGETKSGAPGVYVNEAKICSLGLRISKGCAYHGLALNVDMDLEPFNRINPCGFKQLKMTQVKAFQPTITLACIRERLTSTLLAELMPNQERSK